MTLAGHSGKRTERQTDRQADGAARCGTEACALAWYLCLSCQGGFAGVVSLSVLSGRFRRRGISVCPVREVLQAWCFCLSCQGGKLIVQPPADQESYDAAMFHYTWGSIWKEQATGKEVWKFDKRFYTDKVLETKVPPRPTPAPCALFETDRYALRSEPHIGREASSSRAAGLLLAQPRTSP
jgi:hypothetical protein